jgi:hypothetical protein
MPADYRIACATYNGKLVSEQAQSVLSDSSEHLSAWLAPSLLRQTDDDDGRSRGEQQPAPDFVAIGFQEMIPLVRGRCLLTAPPPPVKSPELEAE